MPRKVKAETKIHWTQTPEGKARQSMRQKEQWKKRKEQKELQVTLNTTITTATIAQAIEMVEKEITRQQLLLEDLTDLQDQLERMAIPK